MRVNAPTIGQVSGVICRIPGLSPGGAAVVSQGRKPLVNRPNKNWSPGGATERRTVCPLCRPSGAAEIGSLGTRGLRPWLTTAAPPGLKQNRPRSGFTLIELLVVIAIIVTLATLIVAIAPQFGDRQRASRGASTVQSWLNLAKQRAIRDRRPVGIRIPYSPASPTAGFVTELQYVEIPDEGIGGTMTVPFATNYPPSSVKTFSTYQCVLFTTTVSFVPGTPTALIQPGDVVEFADRPMAMYAPRQVASVQLPSQLNPQPSPPVQNSFASGTVTLFNYFLLLDQAVPSAPQFSTKTHVVSRKARPVVGEPVLQMPKDIAIDVSRGPAISAQNSLPSWYRMFPPTANTGGTSPFDILFSPSGQVIGYEGNLGSRICLWVRDVSLNDPDPPAGQTRIFPPYTQNTDPRKLPPGYNALITVYTRTGHVTSHPINPLGLVPNTAQNATLWNPFQFTQDGLTSGNAGN